MFSSLSECVHSGNMFCTNAKKPIEQHAYDVQSEGFKNGFSGVLVLAKHCHRIALAV